MAKIFSDPLAAIADRVGSQNAGAPGPKKSQSQSIEQFQFLPLREKDRAAAIRLINLVGASGVAIKRVKRSRKAGIAINHRFFRSRNISAKETGMALELSRRARFSKSTRTGCEAEGVHVPRIWPLSVTTRGRFRTARNSFVKRRVEIWTVPMSDKAWQTSRKTQGHSR